MNTTTKFNVPLSQVVGDWFSDLRTRYYFKFVLPRIESTTIDGIELDLTPFSPRIRNRILLGYEEAEKEICREFLSEDDSVVEIGAAIGFIGLFCTKRLGIKNYISIEANPNTIEILKRNYSRNGLVPHVWNFAVGGADGFVDLDISGDFWSHSIASSSESADTERVRVPAITLSSLLAKLGGPTTLIIDIEGAEQDIDFTVVPHETTKIVMELHPHVTGKKGAERILENLSRVGFIIVHEQDDTVALLRGDSLNKRV